MYVWRFPMMHFAVLLTAALLIIIGFVLLELRQRTQNLVVRGLFSGAVIAALLCSPALVEIVTARELRTLARAGVYIHYGMPVFIGPAVIAGLLLFMTGVLFKGPRDLTLAWRVVFLGAVILFGVFNLANWCSPGWCEQFGFPFPYSWWSDAIIEIDGKNLTAGNSPLGLTLNLVFLVIVATIYVSVFRRRVLRPAAGLAPSDGSEVT